MVKHILLVKPLFQGSKMQENPYIFNIVKLFQTWECLEWIYPFHNHNVFKHDFSKTDPDLREYARNVFKRIKNIAFQKPTLFSRRTPGDF
jgi:hypothetical protein